MNEHTLIAKIYQIAQAFDPDVDDSTSFQDLLQDLELMKDKALKFEILENTFKPEPQLPVIKERGDFRMQGNTIWL
tara:strand:- start:944 stop:1171 length:228 start_codon:yes stop_codon:yes gene_type:complete